MEIDVQEKIKRLLHTRRRTKKELCDATGISPMGLHDMFKRNDMKLSSLYKILLFFNISITDFFLENKNQEVISLKEQIKELQSNLFHEESTFQMYKNQND